MLKAAISSPQQASPPHLQAVVTGVSGTQVIEFTFVYGDPDLSVELVLPLAAFLEFCIGNGCSVAVPDDRLRASVRRLIQPLPVAPYLSSIQTEQSALTSISRRRRSRPAGTLSRTLRAVSARTSRPHATRRRPTTCSRW